TVARLRSAADRLGYRPNLAARALRAGATRTVWLLTGSFNAVNERLLVRSAAQSLEAGGYDLLLAEFRDDAGYERLLGRLDQGLADAALVIAGGESHPESPTLRALIARRYPLVFLDRGPGWEGVPTVSTDNVGATRELVRRLATSGIRRLVFVEWGSNDVSSLRASTAVAEARKLGLQAALSRSLPTAWLANGQGPLGVVASSQGDIHDWCTENATALRGIEMRFAVFDDWTGEPYPSPVVFVAIQDFAGMAERAARRLLAQTAEGQPWSDESEHLPLLRIDEIRARL
ncbi:MAG: LacI family DNA-binding transcriptional regulator, partial [Planctomycetes bacterium]|nr:LacI family DNA-binding transcriptional regulator [Planctomycetota bacterium]